MMTCIHHWMIDTPNGPLSKGKCCKCGATSMFPNEIITRATWQELDVMSNQRRMEKRARKTRMDFALSSIPQRVNR